MATVFDSDKYLDAWKQFGEWPRIHDEMIGLIHYAAQPDASILDLCCSVGLLPQRIQDQLGRQAAGVEWLPEVIEKAQGFGIDVPIMNLQISRDTMGELEEWMTANEVNAVSARRCLSEIAVPPKVPNGPPSTDVIDWEMSEIMFGMFADIGVTDIWLQGRARSVNSVHPVPDTVTEIEWVVRSGAYELHKTTKNCAWLVRA